MDQQIGWKIGWKNWIGMVISTLIGMVVGYQLGTKGTAIGGIITVVCCLCFIPFGTVRTVKFLGKKEWGRALVCAAIGAGWGWILWMALSHSPWHQLPEEVDKVLNILTRIFK